ncbi:hypothetical protein H310_13352 [Aphanomyces invadans]|uniref:Peptidase C1A papain C-terminal domain-containing protein n=1 Tax=Aphanomyces invadans TaxID=157072 RepID=A0A024TE47_9STRA|nr:hypothetical protein H310_13352 [Aphanomyces invadans]ETV92294.1 hypothetical protein H310_13352 [Aphanomyces invadans]RHY15860.1 hypothetical protein DYB32_010707 [Aphanomyces invadans]|eukprot:XP_008879045.1 hypothetical protein H310_13352 [Aphanomyces invadans]
MLSSDERSVLPAELSESLKEFGPDAAVQGLLPRATESSSRLEAENDVLQRYYDKKLAIVWASHNNPDTTFDYIHPFALLTQAGSAISWRVCFSKKAEVRSNRSMACVNPVRNKANAIVVGLLHRGCAESTRCIVTREPLDLPEQQVTSCSTESGSAGCNGGWPYAAMTYVSMTGICLESDYP